MSNIDANKSIYPNVQNTNFSKLVQNNDKKQPLLFATFPDTLGNSKNGYEPLSFDNFQKQSDNKYPMYEQQAKELRKAQQQRFLLEKNNTERSSNPYRPLTAAENKLKELEDKSIRKGRPYSKRQKELTGILKEFIETSLPYLNSDFCSENFKEFDYENFLNNFSTMIDGIDEFNDAEYKQTTDVVNSALKDVSESNITKLNKKIENLIHLSNNKQKFRGTSVAALDQKEQLTRETQEKFQKIINNEGVISDLVNMTKIGTTRSQVSHSISSTFADINKLKKMVQTDPVKFMNDYQLMFGVPFRVENFEQLKKDKAEFHGAELGQKAKECVDFLNNADLSDKMSRSNNLTKCMPLNYSLHYYQGQDNLRSGSTRPSNLEIALMKYFNNDADSVKSWIDARTEKLNIKQLSELEKYGVLKDLFVAEMKQIEERGLKGKQIEQYEDKYKKSLRQTYGNNIPEERLNSYINTQKYSKFALEMGIIALTGGTSVPGIAIATAGTTFVVNTSEQSTSQNGFTRPGQVLEILATSAFEGVMAGAAGIAVKTAASKLLAKKSGKIASAEKPVPEQVSPKTQVEQLPVKHVEKIDDIRTRLIKEYGQPKVIKQPDGTYIELYKNRDKIIKYPDGKVEYVKAKEAHPNGKKADNTPNHKSKKSTVKITETDAKKLRQQLIEQHGEPIKKINGKYEIDVFKKSDGTIDIIAKLANNEYVYKTIKLREYPIKKPEDVSANIRKVFGKTDVSAKTAADREELIAKLREKLINVYKNDEKLVALLDEGTKNAYMNGDKALRANILEKTRSMFGKVLRKDFKDIDALDPEIQKIFDRWGLDGEQLSRHITMYDITQPDRLKEIRNILPDLNGKGGPVEITMAMDKAVKIIKNSPEKDLLMSEYIKNGTTYRVYFYKGQNTLNQKCKGVKIIEEVVQDGKIRYSKYSTVMSTEYEDFIINTITDMALSS